MRLLASTSWILHTLFLSIAFLCGVVSAQEVAITNSSFEDGQASMPDGWTLSGGDGAWLEGDAADGKYAVSVTGKGEEDTNQWCSPALPLEPSQLYMLRFQAKRTKTGTGGTAITGPVFCNVDYPELSTRWTPYKNLFLTPSAINENNARIRFGQWHAHGSLMFDNIIMTAVQPIHVRVGDIELGDSEEITGNAYDFRLFADRYKTNYRRALYRYGCFYNTNRYVMGKDSELVFRYALPGRKMTKGFVRFTLKDVLDGEIEASVSLNDKDWRVLTTLGASNAESDQLDLPADLFPADEIFVRFRAHTSRALGNESDMGSVLLSAYWYHAEFDGDPIVAVGRTDYVEVPLRTPGLGVKVLCLGAFLPGKDNKVILSIDNPGPAMADVPARLAMKDRDGQVCWESVQSVQIPPGQSIITLPYEVSAAGLLTLSVRLGDAYECRAERHVPEFYASNYGALVPGSSDVAALWWCSSGWKVSRDRVPPAGKSEAIQVSLAGNETEAVQLVIHPDKALKGFHVAAGKLIGPDGHSLPPSCVDIRRVHYLPVEIPTDHTGVKDNWPDPLPPFNKPIDLQADQNQPIWISVTAPPGSAPGVYEGEIHLKAEGYAAVTPIHVTVYGFDLPDTMSCVSAFGFSPGTVFQYHGLKNEADQRAILHKYLQCLSDHHISPYDPTPMDSFKVTWPDIKPGDKADPEQLKVSIDWDAWDAAMARAFNEYHFTSFKLPLAGMGGGTFDGRTEPSLLGFGENTSEYKALFRDYCQQIQEHLREKNWLDKTYVYWFDEPAPRDYEFVMNGFLRLKDAAPDITRMLTEQVEPELVGGPNLWCPISNDYDHEDALQRRRDGDKFWWYVCTGPKAPYATLFIDHPGTEMRVWLWQTWQRGIDGILIWETNLWNSPAAYPDPAHPQNPYEDPMGWSYGYSNIKSGDRIPWGNGDGRFVYPPETAASGRPEAPVFDDPVPCIRLVMLRDGIEDYEYMAILKRLLSEKGAGVSADVKTACEALLEVPEDITSGMTVFTTDPGPMETHRDKVARAIERLSAVK